MDWRLFRLYNTALVGGQSTINFNRKNRESESIEVVEEEQLDIDEDFSEEEERPASGQHHSSRLTAHPSSKAFISEYFANSRLHHLSLWKQDLKDMVIKSLASRPLIPPGKSRVIMHVDMDCFFASSTCIV